MFAFAKTITFSFALALCATLASAQEITLLTEKYEQKLNEKALPVYKEGASAFDFINYDRAVNLFYKAMQQDSKHVKLRFLVGRFAAERAQMKQGEEALKYFEMARQAYTGLITMEGLKPEDRRRAETDLQETQKLIADLYKRDTRREATGKQVIEQVVKEREAFAQSGLKQIGLASEESAMAARGGKGGAAAAAGKPGAPAAAGVPNGYYNPQAVAAITK